MSNIRVRLRPQQGIRVGSTNKYLFDPDLILDSVNLAEDWATKTDGIVDSTDYSSKAYAIGGTGTETNNAKYYAGQASTSASNAYTSETNASSSATSAGNSASTATTQAGIATTKAGEASTSATNASNSANLAKDWATKTSAAVADGEYSAKYNASVAKDWASKANDKVDSDY